jgi:hypothetical protein
VKWRDGEPFFGAERVDGRYGGGRMKGTLYAKESGRHTATTGWLQCDSQGSKGSWLSVERDRDTAIRGRGCGDEV